MDAAEKQMKALIFFHTPTQYTSHCIGCKIPVANVKVSAQYEKLVLYHIKKYGQCEQSHLNLPVTHSHLALLSSLAKITAHQITLWTAMAIPMSETYAIRFKQSAQKGHLCFQWSPNDMMCVFVCTACTDSCLAQSVLQTFGHCSR